ncbi:MAG: hypothetical protein ACYCRH_04145 [Acidiferrobacteraceae bacterium]
MIEGTCNDTLYAGMGSDTFDYVAPAGPTPTTETIIDTGGIPGLSGTRSVGAGTTPLRSGAARARSFFAWTALFLVGVLAASPGYAAKGASPPTRSYHFTLTKGAGIQVCRAYLKRLNTARYAAPPYCDIPEATSAPGFTPLHRVPLTAAQAGIMTLRVTDFMGTQRQGTKKEYETRRAADVAALKHLESVVGPAAVLTTKKLLQRGELVAWRYDPPVDIENDGRPDDVLVWRGGNLEPTVCGHPAQTSQFETDGRVPQVAFILAPSKDPLNIPIDIAKTKAVFGYPGGGYHYPGQSIPDQRFRPLGPTLGIFKYKNLYYSETFLFNNPVDFWGLLTAGKDMYNPRQANDLAVFLHRHGKTREVCQYHMTETK